MNRPWGEGGIRAGGMQQGGAVRVSVVGVGFMALDEASLLYAICNELRGLGCGIQVTSRSKGRSSSRPVAYSSLRILYFIIR